MKPLRREYQGWPVGPNNHPPPRSNSAIWGAFLMFAGICFIAFLMIVYVLLRYAYLWATGVL